MDLRHYEHVVALAEEGTFVRAAHRVHLSQPAFSRSIQAAERDLKLNLFERSGKGIRTTAAGALVVDRMRALLNASASLHRDAAMFRDGTLGDLRVGIGPFLAVALLPALLREMRSRYPKVRVRAVVQHPEPLILQMRSKQLEFVVVDRRFVPSDLDVEPVVGAPAALFVRAGHPLLLRRKVRMEHLAAYGLALPRLPEASLANLRRAMGVAEDGELPLAVECDDMSALKAVALETDAVVPGTRLLLQHELASGALRELVVEEPPSELTTHPVIVSERGRAFSPAAAFATQFLRSIGPAASVPVAPGLEPVARPKKS